METGELFQKLINKVRSYHPSDDLSMIERAYDLANTAHNSQLRKSGEPYIIHPLEVAYILAELELDIESITAGLLHDVVEDTHYTLEEIEEIFNKEVALLVDGVTKLSQIRYSSQDKQLQKEEIQAENYRKMFLAMAQDIRVVLIKLADRLHNMRTLKFMSPHKQKEKAQETLTIYAPIAHRLGICKIKADLEDLSFRYLEPEVYYELANQISQKRDERTEFIEEIVGKIKTKLKEVNIQALVEGRPKHFFSIYKKMFNKQKTLDQIYDLFAVRAIVKDVKDCYEVLGVVHDLFTPIPGRFKDYIAIPKANMYQSLHTTLMGPNGIPYEMQIRTEEMHRTAEYGIAAHWKYKDGKVEGKLQDKSEEKLAWLRQILEWQRDMSDNSEFMDALKLDLDVYTDQVYVFSPKGELLTLPQGSTPIDFAYYIHSDVGNRMIGAKANGKIVTYDYVMKNGDRLEILVSKANKGPSKDWLNIVKSTQAKNKINQWFRRQFKDEDIQRGKEVLELCAKHKGYVLSELLDEDCMRNVYLRYGLKNWKAIYAAIGYGSIKEKQILQRLVDENIKKNNIVRSIKTDQEVLEEVQLEEIDNSQYHEVKSNSGVIIEDLGEIAVRFAKCCKPLPGDKIIGYITRGRGVSVHRTDCPNVVNISPEEKARLVGSKWQQQGGLTYSYVTEIQIISIERAGMLLDVSKVLTDIQAPVKSLNASTTKNGEVIFKVRVEIDNTKKLDELTKQIKKIADVIDVIRVST
ncbi:(p)ppGpp synthetase [Candidatus Epulonipiscium fishelsonii]|uniref:(P)ppGpp synthetase n=1 Tax=Candidatus Epulonipiscium fishelsonii TaxID=77094 RepID=A0ACC8XIS3_9FIRM|nr:(p)ppGpp synthetase [Epulopiscium sp. SCG-D08WGA-EpuloA1]OON93796.1 MAG: (p)ppGpp synthetase [Epulopiscium sp. AS2M-Bin002]